MYNFILIQWKLGKITETEIEIFVSTGKITKKQAKTIMAESQASNG